MNRIIVVFLQMGMVCFSCMAFVIDGKLLVPDSEGDVHIFIFREDQMGEPMFGEVHHIVRLGEGETFCDYILPDIPPGEYGIRAYQDCNGNGRLDVGLFGPAEPWFLSWQSNPKRFPRFEDVSISLQHDLTIQIVLER